MSRNALCDILSLYELKVAEDGTPAEGDHKGTPLPGRRPAPAGSVS